MAGYHPMDDRQAHARAFEFLFLVQTLENAEELSGVFHVEAHAVILDTVHRFAV